MKSICAPTQRRSDPHTAASTRTRTPKHKRTRRTLGARAAHSQRGSRMGGQGPDCSHSERPAALPPLPAPVRPALPAAPPHVPRLRLSPRRRRRRCRRTRRTGRREGPGRGCGPVGGGGDSVAEGPPQPRPYSQATPISPSAPATPGAPSAVRLGAGKQMPDPRSGILACCLRFTRPKGE